MFQELTKYLFQNKQVAIPQVGVFQLVQKPAMLDYANKLIQPPSFTVQFSSTEVEHHIDDTYLNSNGFSLDEFGKRLKIAIEKGRLIWNGVGSFQSKNGQIEFYPQQISVDALTAVDANKVLRENVQHQVLQGEKQVMQSIKDMDDEVIQPMEKNSYTLIVGWILVIILFAFIIYLFVSSV